MKNQRRRLLAFALVLCMLLPLFATVNAAETEPVADTPAAEAPETAVPATEMPASTSLEPIEAEQQVSLSDDGICIIKGESKSLIPEPEANRGDAALGTAGSANPLTAAGVVWTSSDPTVATVDSTGTVTAHELGETTITATLNGSVLETFTVYSTLSDGYYTIKAYMSSHYLCPDVISMKMNVAMHAMPISSAGTNFRYQIGYQWYFEYQNNGYYSIHPAFSRNMVLYLFGGAIPFLRQESTLSDYSGQWKIVSGNYGYVLQNRASDDTVLAFSEPNTNEASLTSMEYDTSDNYQGWSFNSATPPSGMLLFDTVSGELIDNTWTEIDDEHKEYAPKGVASSFEDLGMYLQILDPTSSSQAFIMSFTPNNATFNMSNHTITGTTASSAAITAKIQRVISGALEDLEFDLVIKNVEAVSVMYDSAYAYRYSTDYLSRINQQTQAASAKFTQVGHFVSFNAPIPFTSYGDTCSTNHSVNCTHSSSPCFNVSINPAFIEVNYENGFPTSHHKNLYNIFARVAITNANKSINYIGHNVCYDGGAAGHVINTVGAGGYIYGMSSRLNELVQNLDGLAQIYDHVSLASSTATTVHELGHLFGAVDHYGEGTKTTRQMNIDYACSYFSEDCIYGENKNSDSRVIDNTIICEGCYRMLTDNLPEPN